MITIENFYSPSFEDFDINLVQKEVDGGAISTEAIDSIKQYPHASSIVVSGLKQDTFEYFIKEYADQFEAISFWKNKTVNNLSILSQLKNVKFISYFFNQKASGLWDMSQNENLKGLSITDFSKLHSIEEVTTAKNLEFFRVGDAVDSKMVIESLRPIVRTNISHLVWSGKKVEDYDYKCLAKGNLKVLDISPVRFTVDELTDILALFPESIEGWITKPYVTGGIKDQDGYHEYHMLCKGKKKCIAGVDDERFQKYLEDFSKMLAKKRNR